MTVDLLRPDPAWLSVDPDDKDHRWHAPAPFLRPHERAASGAQSYTRDALLEIARRNMLNPAVLDREGVAPFFWSNVISTNRLDARKTRMADTSLRNYAAAAEAGVSVDLNHNHVDAPIGYSLTGQFIGPGGNGVARVVVDAFTLAGIGGDDARYPDPAHTITRIESGLLRDTSIAYYGGSYRCSICDTNYWRCSHWAGESYPVGAQKTPTEAFIWIDDAQLSNFGLVYDGATPGAAIIKAYRAMQSGELPPEVAAKLERIYHCAPGGLGSTARFWAGYATGQKGTKMSDTELTTNSALPLTVKSHWGTLETATSAYADLVGALNRSFGSEWDPEGDPTELATALTDARSALVKRAEAAEQQVDDLKRDAEDGRAYRTHLLDALEAAAVRAIGDATVAKLDREAYAAAPVGSLRAKISAYDGMSPFKNLSGRQTVDAAPTPTPIRSNARSVANA